MIVEEKKYHLSWGKKSISTQTVKFICPNSNFCSACGKTIAKDQKNRINCLEISCKHVFCIDCLKRLVSNQIQVDSTTEILCPICCHPLNDDEIDKIDPTYSKIITNRLAKQFGHVIICPKCKADFILEPGSAALITHDFEGKKYGMNHLNVCDNIEYLIQYVRQISAQTANRYHFMMAIHVMNKDYSTMGLYADFAKKIQQLDVETSMLVIEFVGEKIVENT